MTLANLPTLQMRFHFCALLMNFCHKKKDNKLEIRISEIETNTKSE